jgi:hypothetical protein
MQDEATIDKCDGIVKSYPIPPPHTPFWRRPTDAEKRELRKPIQPPRPRTG